MWCCSWVVVVVVVVVAIESGHVALQIFHMNSIVVMVAALLLFLKLLIRHVYVYACTFAISIQSALSQGHTCGNT
jgi:hypothetical protein